MNYFFSRNNLVNVKDFDIVGGGFVIGWDVWIIYICGELNIVINNVVVWWIYGGLFFGVVEGNIFNILNGGIVDILEGSGYEGGWVYGNV